MGFPPYLIGLGIPLLVGLLGLGLFIFNQERQQKHYQYGRYEKRERISLYEDSSETCTICLECMNDSDSVALTCGHRLHSACLVELNKRNQNKCPQCRADIVY